MNENRGRGENGEAVPIPSRPDSDSVDDRKRKHEALIARLLSDAEKQEALSWLRNSRSDDPRTIGGCDTTQDSVKFVQELYQLGALRILAVNIHPNRNGAGQHTGKLVLELPEQPAPRQALFDWCKRQGDSIGFTPDPDMGEHYLFLLLD